MVAWLPMPKYKEFLCKAVWNFVKEVPKLLKYFSDLTDNELPDRMFLWTVLSTLRSDDWKIMLEEARKPRCKQSEDNNREFIEKHPYLLKKILAAPMLTKGTFI